MAGPQFLLPAIGLLEAARTAHLGIAADYARQRRMQKDAGLRLPPRRDVTPEDPRRWRGDERLGALHVLRSWPQLRSDQAVAEHPGGRIVLAAVESTLEIQPEPADSTMDLDELQRTPDWSRRQIHVTGWGSDRTEHHVAWVVRHLLSQLHLVANGATPVATPWDFRS